MSTLQQNVDSLNKLSKELLGPSEEEFGKWLESRIGDLNRRWEEVKQLADQQRSRLLQGEANTKQFQQSAKQLQAWVDNVNKEHLAREYTIHSVSQLQQTLSKFEVHQNNNHPERRP